MTNQVIPETAVEAAARALSIHTMIDDSPENEKFREAVRMEARRALEAAAPHIAAQVLREAIAAFPLETITAPDNAVVWLMRRADNLSERGGEG